MDKIDWQIEHISELSSTNDHLYNRIMEDSSIPEGAGILTDFQNKGKGQIGNSWVSEAGENMLLSFLLKPGISVDKQFVISQLISLAIVDVLTYYDLDEVRIKWPNDIYVGERKIAGILIQNILKGRTIMDCIVGIGLNVNQVQFPPLPNPTSMALVNAQFYNIPEVKDRILDKVDEYYQQIFQYPKNQINHLYHFLLYRRNVESKFQMGSRIFNGIIKKVAEDGRLYILTDLGEEKFTFRELSFII